jgi:hypothetical protein
MSDENNFPLPHVPKFPGALFDEFGQRADERVHVYAMVHAAAAEAAEREHMAELEARIVELSAEVAMLRETMEGAAYQLSKARIWGGMEWHYNPLHPLHYRPALDRLREVLDRAEHQQ